MFFDWAFVPPCVHDMHTAMIGRQLNNLSDSLFRTTQSFCLIRANVRFSTITGLTPKNLKREVGSVFYFYHAAEEGKHFKAMTRMVYAF